MKGYAYRCDQVDASYLWLPDRRGRVSIDPLYSSGGDLMAISNGLIMALIDSDLERGADRGPGAGAQSALPHPE
jgi:hypothetical protein